MNASSIHFHLPTREAVDFRNLASPSEELDRLTAHLLKNVLTIKSFVERFSFMVNTYFAGDPSEIFEADVGDSNSFKLSITLLSEDDDLLLRVQRTDNVGQSIFNGDWVLLKDWRPEYSGFQEDEYFDLADSFHCAMYQALAHVLTTAIGSYVAAENVEIAAWLTSPDLHGQSGFLVVQPTYVLARSMQFRQELGEAMRETRKHRE